MVGINLLYYIIFRIFRFAMAKTKIVRNSIKNKLKLIVMDEGNCLRHKDCYDLEPDFTNPAYVKVIIH